MFKWLGKLTGSTAELNATTSSMDASSQGMVTSTARLPSLNLVKLLYKLKQDQLTEFNASAFAKWNINPTPLVDFLAHLKESIRTVAILPNGLVATGSSVWKTTRPLQLWDLKQQKCVAELSGHSGQVYVLKVLPEGLLASGSHDKMVKLCDTVARRCVATLKRA